MITLIQVDQSVFAVVWFPVFLLKTVCQRIYFVVISQLCLILM